MATMGEHSGHHDLVGRRVRKLFPGFGVFEGSITSFNPVKGFYKVEYDDGDREDMELHEVQQILLQEAPFSNVAILPSDDHVNDPPAAFPPSSPFRKYAAAAPSPAAPSSLSFPSLELSNTGGNVNNLHCFAYLHRVSQPSCKAELVGTPALPLSQDHSTQILQNNCSRKGKRSDGCNCVQMSTKRKRARRKEKDMQANATCNVAVTWMTQCVKDSEEDDASISEHVENDMDEKTEHLQDVKMCAKSSQNQSHGDEDEESLSNGVPSAHSSVSVEYAIQDLNYGTATLPPLEPPPPSSGDFLVPGDSVLDFLEIYSFLRSFSRALFLSPFSLECFQHCLRSHTPTALMDSIHLCLLQALRRNLEKLAKTGLAIARGCLRHLDWTLLDVITWPLHLQAYLAAYAFKGRCAFKFALTRVEYYKLAVENKVAVLNFLCHHIMDTDEIRAEIATRELLFIENLEEDRNGMPQILVKEESQQPEYAVGGAFKVEMLKKHEVKEKNSDECVLCGMNGNLLCCDGCPGAYHARCVGISKSTLPQGDWLCPECAIDGRDKKYLNSTGLRGGNFLGLDPYGHTYLAAWGYLLVIRPSTVSMVNYYNSKDLPLVMHWLEKMRPFCDPAVKSKIRHYWYLLQRNLPESCVLARQEVILKTTQTCDHLQPRRETFEGFARIGENVSERWVLDLPVLNFRLMGGANKFDLETTNGILPRCGVTESSRLEKLGFGQPLDNDLCGHNLVEAGADNYTSEKLIESDRVREYFQYTNCYSQGDAAATAAASLATQDAKRKTKQNPFNEQLEAFCKSSVQFYWPNVHRESMEATDENCGWCFCCSDPNIKEGCVLNRAARILAAGAARVPGGIRPTKFGTGHLPSVAGYILHIEDNLKALLLGQWQDAGFRKRWRKKVKRAEHVHDLKALLIQLESCLRPVLLLGKWFNDQEKAPSSTCTPMAQPSRLHSIEALLLQSWKYGKNSRKVFQWNLLPSHIVRQAARQGGLKKIQGLVYSEELDWARRNQRCAWQVRVEAACTVSQLALQVRVLDAYIRWDDLHSLSRMDRGLPATIYAKKWEGDVPLYVADLKIVRHTKKTSKLVYSKDADKVWVTDTQIPLPLLRNFEERLMQQNKHGNKHVAQVSRETSLNIAD